MDQGQHVRRWSMPLLVLLMFCIGLSASELTLANYHILGRSYAVDDGAELQPITIVAARNGVFSGAVVVRSTTPITGLRSGAPGWN